eukprot:6191194-Pleurochrysis_carterae.AAC.7
MTHQVSNERGGHGNRSSEVEYEHEGPEDERVHGHGQRHAGSTNERCRARLKKTGQYGQGRTHEAEMRLSDERGRKRREESIKNGDYWEAIKGHGTRASTAACEA